MLNAIFDLDHTVLDSSHRQLTKPCGGLDLDHWRENCTREKIFADKLLPLAETLRKAVRDPRVNVIICTARVLSFHDIEFLTANKLADKNTVVLSRSEGDRSADADLKERLLKQHCAVLGHSFYEWARNSMMLDDNQQVLERVRSLGIVAHDAKHINHQLMLMRKGA